MIEIKICFNWVFGTSTFSFRCYNNIKNYVNIFLLYYMLYFYVIRHMCNWKWSIFKEPFLQFIVILGLFYSSLNSWSTLLAYNKFRLYQPINLNKEQHEQEIIFLNIDPQTSNQVINTFNSISNGKINTDKNKVINNIGISSHLSRPGDHRYWISRR